MDPFSFKADLEAQTVDEWFDLIQKLVVRGLVRTLLQCTRRIFQICIRTIQGAVQAGIPRTANRVDHPARNLIDERQTQGDM